MFLKPASISVPNRLGLHLYLHATMYFVLVVENSNYKLKTAEVLIRTPN